MITKKTIKVSIIVISHDLVCLSVTILDEKDVIFNGSSNHLNVFLKLTQLGFALQC